MNSIENYLLYRSRTLSKTIPANFIISMLCTMVSFGTVFLLFTLFPPEAAFGISKSAVYDKPASTIVSVIEALSGTVISLAVLYASCFTVFARRIMLSICVFRGASLGCAAAVLSSGMFIAPPERASLSLMIYFFSTVIFVILAAYAGVYADCILRICSAGSHRYRKAVTREFSLCFLTLSGAVLSAGMIQMLLLKF